MRIFRKITMALSALALCAACTSEDDVFQPEGNLENGLTATIPAYQFDDGTRVNISDDLQTFTWSDNDELGIYYTDDNAHAQAGFTIRQGGSSTGVFSNDIFYLNPEKTYYAFYPYNSSFTTTTAEVDFTGQTQTANASAAHLGAYNYMYGNVTINNKSANVNFKNLGSVMQLQLTASNAATFTSIDIVSDNVKFITKGKASMIDGSITVTELSDSIRLPFENGIALEAGNVLTANLLTAPVDLSSSNLTITVKDADNNDYVVVTTGKNMLQGKAYLYAEVLPYVDVNEIPYVTFKADAAQTFKMDTEVSSMEYSMNNGNWTLLGTSTITFGGEYGNLRLRGKSSTGTGSANVQFGNETKVACLGDIRTLIDYENYTTTNTGNAKFEYLFKNCGQLTSAPNLPSTSLAESCYRSMFESCTSLLNAPELPAKTLSSNCYENMFVRCTSLTTPPTLPATTLAQYCYSGMFYECSSLTQAPNLPATSLAPYCYKEMFLACKKIISAPELPAKDLYAGCYNAMFDGCISLTQAPELPATVLVADCYRSMFKNCNSLRKAPALPTTKLIEHAYAGMFENCSSLIEAPELPATILAPGCYSYMFLGCKSLVNAPELPATTIAEGCYYHMFEGCSSLIKAPQLPATEVFRVCYEAMFAGCTSLTEAPDLPALVLAESCYSHMFEGCISLTKIDLPATSLHYHCYFKLLNGCWNLTYIRMMAPEVGVESISLWVEGVPGAGIFVKNPVWTSFSIGASGIPDGWTVVDYTDSTGPDMSGSDMGGDW